MNYRAKATYAAAICAVLAIVGCGGGGSPTLSPPLPAATPVSALPGGGGGTAPSGKATVRFTIEESASAQTAVALEQQYRIARSGRTPMFVSPNTAGVTISATPSSGGTTQTFVYDVSASSAICVTTGSTRTCTMTIQITPGTYTFVMTLYDAAPTGSPPAIPASAHALGVSYLGSVTIQPNALNAVAFAVEGIVAGVSLSGGTTFLSAPSNGTAHTLGVAIVADDASGAPITGTYAAPISVSLAESGGSGHTVLVKDGVASGSSVSLTSSSDTLAMQYDGGGSAGYTALATLASGSATDAVRMSPMYVSGPLLFSDQAQTKNVTISEADSPFTSAPAIAWSCAGFSPSTSGSNASATYSVTSPTLTYDAPVPSFACPGTVTITDALGTSMTTSESGSLPVATYCASTGGVANLYLGAKDGSGNYKVSNGSPCALVVTPANSACTASLSCETYMPAGNASYPGTAALTVSEADDVKPVAVAPSCSGVFNASSGSLAGGSSLSASAGGALAFSNGSSDEINYSCSATISDGNGQVATVKLLLDPMSGWPLNIPGPITLLQNAQWGSTCPYTCADILLNNVTVLADEQGNFLTTPLWPSGFGIQIVYSFPLADPWVVGPADYCASHPIDNPSTPTTYVGEESGYPGNAAVMPAAPGATGYLSITTPSVALGGQSWQQILSTYATGTGYSGCTP